MRRLRLVGAGALRDAQLLALLLAGPPQRRTRQARRLLAEAGGAHGFGQLSYPELRGLGLGPRATQRCLAAIELGRRASYRPPLGPCIHTPADAHAAVAGLLAFCPRERFAALVLGPGRRLQRVALVGEGTAQVCPVDVPELFAVALKARGTGLIVAHNHPSGSLTPSSADLSLTARLRQAGTLLGVPLVDHLIVHGPRYLSLAGHGGAGLEAATRHAVAAPAAAPPDPGDELPLFGRRRGPAPRPLGPLPWPDGGAGP